MNRLRIFLSILFCMSCLITGCLDSIDFEQPDTINDRIAIQGKLVKGSPSFVQVTIRRVFDFKAAPRLISARAVTLSDELGNTISLSTRAEGIFFKEIQADDPNIKIDFDKSYKIIVEIFDGQIFESTLETILPTPTPTELKVKRIQKDIIGPTGEIITRDNFVGFTIDTPLEVSPGLGNVKLLWELEATYKITDTPETHGRSECAATRIDAQNKVCYASFSPATNFIPLDGTQLSVNAISDLIIYETIISSIFSEGYYLNVFQQSLTDETFEYWSQVKNVTDRIGNIFEAPAGKVKSNITNTSNPAGETFGYFYATEEKVIRVFVDSILVDMPRISCPGMLSTTGQAPRECCDCLTLENATTEKPIWWE